LNKAPRKMVVSINSCSADSLEMLKGIGPVFAKRIVAFRLKLGGFYSLSQLSEVYGLPIETIELILPKLNLDTTQIKRIRVNSADVKALSKHPYISYNEAKAIVNYRDQHGEFLQLATLRKLHIFKNKSINRLLPYLDLN
jgi:DNA uptake protein ComE-like DNA-binding protein